jgi:hypothetical protein
MSLDLAELMAEADRLSVPAGGQGGGKNGGFLDNFVKMPKRNGFVQVRLLPPGEATAAGKKLFYQATRVHKINERSVHCRRELVKGDDGESRWIGECPICEYYSWLWKKVDAMGGKDNPDPAVQSKVAKARALKPQERYYYNALVQESGGVEDPKQTRADGPKILSIGKMLHEKIIKGITGNKTTNKKGYGDVSNVKAGRDFNIARQMKSNAPDAFPEYDDSGYDSDTSPLGDADFVKKTLAALHNLADLRKVPSVEDCEYEVKVEMGYIQDTRVRGGGSAFDPEAKWGALGSAQQAPVSAAAAAVAAPAAAPKATAAPFEETPAFNLNDDGTIGGGGEEAMDMAAFEAELDALGT